MKIYLPKIFGAKGEASKGIQIVSMKEIIFMKNYWLNKRKNMSCHMISIINFLYNKELEEFRAIRLAVLTKVLMFNYLSYTK